MLRNVNANGKPPVVVKTLDKLRKNLNEGGFEVSQASLQSTDFVGMEKELNAADAEKNLPPDLVKKVIGEAATLENIVFAEAITKKIYILPKRRFSTAYLLTEPSKLLKDGAYAKLEEIAKGDFSSSCRCILFGEATAAAFHILRATESVLKSYYFHHRKQKRLTKPMWGPMVDQLRAKAKNKPPQSLLSSLDLIRVAYRNPTQHPEATYEIDSAQDLFGVCLDAIGKMTQEL